MKMGILFSFLPFPALKLMLKFSDIHLTFFCASGITRGFVLLVTMKNTQNFLECLPRDKKKGFARLILQRQYLSAILSSMHVHFTEHILAFSSVEQSLEAEQYYLAVVRIEEI